MKVNRKVREEFNDLSRLVFGTSSKWQKVLDDPNFQVVEENSEYEETEAYVTLANSKKKGGGTVLSIAKAKSLGFVKEDSLGKVKKIRFRQMNEEEMRKYLNNCLDALVLACVEPLKLPSVYAYRLLAGNLKYSYALNVEEDDKEEFDKLLLDPRFPQHLKDSVVDAAGVEKEVALKIGELNGLDFVKALIDMQGETGELVYNELMTEARGIFDGVHKKRFG